MKDMHGLIFAYDANSRLRELTEHRAVSSIPYGGRYRVIDFMLSSMVNSDISDVGIIMRENYQSLLDHLGSGKDWDMARKRGGLRLLPPFGFAGVRGGFYRGKMDALYNVRDYVQKIRQEYVVLASGDVVVNLPLDEIYEYHLANGYEITAVVTPQTSGLAEHETFLTTNPKGRVNSIILGRAELGAVEIMGVYILSRKLLESLISYCGAHSLCDFERDILQAMTDKLNIGTYMFRGYAAKLSTTSEFFQRSMDLLKPNVLKELFPKARPIKTKVRDEPSAYYGTAATAKNSIVADGCYIEGNVENSILSRGVRVGKNAQVRNSIIMQDTIIGEGAVLNYVITDKLVTVAPGTMMMGHENYPAAIGKGAVV
ncbi:glucose-1-phosphate adenylyltransferase subunit GlgD [Clostridia bacterium]|nr:glucose-1-phosphate adenylyltransferase subunit GlgD [Clostridia bacterium]